MRTVNLNAPGQKALDATRGRVKTTRAGTPGQTFADTSGNEVTAPDVLTVGIGVSGEDGEQVILTASGTGQTATNAAGEDLEYGDVVVLDTDGTLILTTTPQDTRPVGVVQVAGADGDPVSALFSGYVAQVNTTGTVNAGEYLETSGTAGVAAASATRRIGSFALALAAGPNPPALMFGIPDLSDLTLPDVAGDFLTNSTGERHGLFTNTDTGSTETLDLEAANTFDLTLTADCTLSFSNPSDAGAEGRWTIVLRQDGTGGWEVTWPASVVWRDTDGTQTATAPTLSTAADSLDVVVISTLDGGVSYGASLENGSNTGITDHGALTGLGDDDHTQYTKKATLTTTGDIYYASGASTPARLGIGSSGNVLTVAGGVPTWAAPTSSSGIGEILISDTPSTPLVFADLLQNEAQDDLLYADP